MAKAQFNPWVKSEAKQLRRNKTLVSRMLQTLKMLDLYLSTFTIGHEVCSLLSILNELTLQMESS